MRLALDCRSGRRAGKRRYSYRMRSVVLDTSAICELEEVDETPSEIRCHADFGSGGRSNRIPASAQLAMPRGRKFGYSSMYQTTCYRTYPRRQADFLHPWQNNPEGLKEVPLPVSPKPDQVREWPPTAFRLIEDHQFSALLSEDMTLGLIGDGGTEIGNDCSLAVFGDALVEHLVPILSFWLPVHPK